MKTYLVADSGYNKEQLSNIAETIFPNFREHEEKRLEKNVPLSHGIARYRTTDKSGFRIFALWFRDNISYHQEAMRSAPYYTNTIY